MRRQRVSVASNNAITATAANACQAKPRMPPCINPKMALVAANKTERACGNRRSRASIKAAAAISPARMTEMSMSRTVDSCVGMTASFTIGIMG